MAHPVLIPTALRQFTEGQAEVVVEALLSLVALNPDVKNHLYNDQGALRSFINVYVNEDNIKQKRRLDTPLAEGDTIMLVPSIAGGAPDARIV